MHLPIQYALTFPRRLPLPGQRIDFGALGHMEFFKPDLRRSPNLKLAFECLKRGGNTGATLNAANEVAVEAFLNGQIRFTDIPRINRQTLEKIPILEHPTLDECRETDTDKKSARFRPEPALNIAASCIM